LEYGLLKLCIIRFFDIAVLFFHSVSVPFSEPCVMGVIVVIVIPVALSVSRKDASGSGLLVTGYLNNIFIFIQAWTPLDIGSQILPRRIPIPPKAKLICGSADQRVICNFLCARVCVIVPRPWKRRPNMLAFCGLENLLGSTSRGLRHTRTHCMVSPSGELFPLRRFDFVEHFGLASAA